MTKLERECTITGNDVILGICLGVMMLPFASALAAILGWKFTELVPAFVAAIGAPVAFATWFFFPAIMAALRPAIRGIGAARARANGLIKRIVMERGE